MLAQREWGRTSQTESPRSDLGTEVTLRQLRQFPGWNVENVSGPRTGRAPLTWEGRQFPRPQLLGAGPVGCVAAR